MDGTQTAEDKRNGEDHPNKTDAGLHDGGDLQERRYLLEHPKSQQTPPVCETQCQQYLSGNSLLHEL